MNHEQLMLITAAMPMRTIPVRGEPYLERYFVGEAPEGTQYWLHRFLRDDSERHLHTHPWTADSFLLCGWYQEELEGGRCELRNALDTGPLRITPDRLHRVAAVGPDTWTLMVVNPGRLPYWKFIEEHGAEVRVPSSPSDWHKNCEPRDLIKSILCNGAEFAGGRRGPAFYCEWCGCPAEASTCEACEGLHS